jgi:hypothetical protein
MSIPHLEDLPPSKLLEVLSQFWEYEATEKLDGSQLLFGIDEDGFYTSRETKGGLRIYNVDDYEVSFKNTYIRSAHIALESVLSSLKDAGLTVGCQVEVEVLYGEFPNVIQYSPDKSFIIFLRTTEGNVDIDHIRVKLADRSLSIPLVAPFTFNGKDIDYKEVTNIWEFARSPVIDINSSVAPDIMYHEDIIHQFLRTGRKQQDYSINNHQLLETKLNQIPDWFTGMWSRDRNEIKMQRDVLSYEYAEFLTDLKRVLLDKIVRGRSSVFGPIDGWIEGVVFRHPKTGHMFKLVDKKLFLKMKDFYWEERNKLFKLAKEEYNLDDLNQRLDKYEKDKSSFELVLQNKDKKEEHSSIQSTRCVYGSHVDSRTKEIFASLYQQIQT